MLKTVVIHIPNHASCLTQGREGVPIPVARVHGMSILERNLRAAQRAGFKHVVVAGDSKWTEKAEPFQEMASQVGLDSDFLASDALEPESLKDTYLFLPANTLFTVETFKQLRGITLGESDDPRLIVDRRFGDLADPAKALKVRIDKGRIMEIGADMLRYEAASTGALVAAPSALLSLVQNREAYLQGVVKEGRLRAHEIDEGICQKIENKEDLRFTEKMLLRRLRKPTDNFVSRVFNRPISLFLSKYLVRTDVRPDVLSLVVLLTGVFSLPLMIQGTYWGFLGGALFYHLASVLDGCDGEVARLKFLETKRGEWLDTFADNATHIFFFLGLTIGLYVKSGSPLPIMMGLAGFGGMIVLLLTMFTYLRRISKRGSLLAFDRDYSQAVSPKTSFLARLGHFLKPLLRRPTFALLFLWLAALNLPEVILFLFAFGTNFAALVIFVTFRRQLRMLTAEEQTQLQTP